MSSSSSNHSLSEDEALAIESAIRASINTVMDVIRSSCERRERQYQEMLADREREIRRLHGKLEESESELKMLRLEAGRSRRRQPEEETSGIHSGEAVNTCDDMKSGPRGAETPTQIPPECRDDTAEAFPHQHLAQSERAPRESQGATGDQPFGSIPPAPVKEEPSDLETIIKWEVCEGERQQEGRHGAQYQHRGRPATTEFSQAECDANPRVSRLTATEHEDECAAHLKRKGRERNRCHLPPESEEDEEELVVKKACVTQQPSAPEITAPKYSLGDLGSLQSLRQTLTGSPTSNLNAQEPLTCRQQQTYVTMSTPQPTCDRAETQKKQFPHKVVRRIQEENAGALSTQPTEPQSAEPEVVNTRNKRKRCEVCEPKMDRKTQYTCIKCKQYICSTHTVKLCPSCFV